MAISLICYCPVLDTQSWKTTNVRSWIPVFSAIPAVIESLLEIGFLGASEEQR